MPTKRTYTSLDLKNTPFEDAGFPGQYPFTQGPYPTMYRGRNWTMRQIAGRLRYSQRNHWPFQVPPRVFLDLREAGETCSLNHVARLMKEHKIKALRGYKAPRVTDITYLRTWQGWLYLAVVVDLFSRRVVGWSMKPTLHRSLVVDALLMAVWRRRPKDTVLVHSDQGSQYGSDDWHRFCRAHNLDPSMSRRGNCWDTQSTMLMNIVLA